MIAPLGVRPPRGRHAATETGATPWSPLSTNLAQRPPGDSVAGSGRLPATPRPADGADDAERGQDGGARLGHDGDALLHVVAAAVVRREEEGPHGEPDRLGVV